MKKRVVVADDHHLVREGICALLDKSKKVEIVGQASTGSEAVELVQQTSPDLVIMDISMPDMDGIQATEQIVSQSPDTRVIILSMHSKVNIVRQALRKGAKGYLLKNSMGVELLLAVEAVFNDNIYISPGISNMLLEKLWDLEDKSGVEPISEMLTSREYQVLQLIVEGHTNKDIADKLVVSIKTVEKHRANLMSKLDVHDVASLIREAIRHDLIFFE